jgi:hypothetical protein
MPPRLSQSFFRKAEVVLPAAASSPELFAASAGKVARQLSMQADSVTLRFGSIHNYSTEIRAEMTITGTIQFKHQALERGFHYVY